MSQPDDELAEQLRALIGAVLVREGISYDAAWSMPVTEAIARAAYALGARTKREECAQVAEELKWHPDGSGDYIATAIRRLPE